MLAGEFCNREVVIVDREATILDAAKLMRSEHVGDVVMTEERDGMKIPTGILTDRDIVVALLAGDVELERVSIEDVMSDDLLCIEEQTGLPETIEKMRQHGVRRAPVVNAEGALVGIVTVDDLLELIAEQMNGLVRLIGTGLGRERSYRKS